MRKRCLSLLRFSGAITPPCRARHPRWRSRATAAISVLGAAAIGFPALIHPAPRLVWNASASAPVGLYLVQPGEGIARGDLVLVHTPDSVRQLAAERGYLPADVPLIKRIVAAGGDVVCATGNVIFINGRVAAGRLSRDRLDRLLPGWNGCHLLDSSEVFLLMQGVTDSFDSRYFGAVPATTIIGRLAPLWTG
ncbi:MAG: S26 family signal peptidase [Immundisolibacter sp.]|uniref:S26 family signal peptidase n=1 Tax=Immundisolibacter sp. TaxID=1934948 RepID=UPI003EE0A3BD